MRLRTRCRFVLLGLLSLAAAPTLPAADLAVPAALAHDPRLGERFAERLARGLQRRRLWATVHTPRTVAQFAEAAALLGSLDADGAAALQTAIETPFLLRCGIAPDATLAVAQLYDLRGPWLLGQASLTAAGPAELLAATDDLAARLEPVWPNEARATVAGNTVTLDRGHVHGFRRGDPLWLLATPERDALGQYARPVALASITAVRPRDAQAVIQVAGPDLEGAADLLAVRPAHLAADPLGGLPLGIWLAREPAGGWRPEVWLDWRRLVTPEIVGERWRVPGQIVRDAAPVLDCRPATVAELPTLEPPGPYRIGQPIT